MLYQARIAKTLPLAKERLRRLRKTLEAMATEALQRRLSRMDTAQAGRICAAVLAGECGFSLAVQQMLDQALAPDRAY